MQDCFKNCRGEVALVASDQPGDPDGKPVRHRGVSQAKPKLFLPQKTRIYGKKLRSLTAARASSSLGCRGLISVTSPGTLAAFDIVAGCGWHNASQLTGHEGYLRLSGATGNLNPP